MKFRANCHVRSHSSILFPHHYDALLVFCVLALQDGKEEQDEKEDDQEQGNRKVASASSNTFLSGRTPLSGTGRKVSEGPTRIVSSTGSVGGGIFNSNRR
jgi:hypothetical protein